MKELNEIVGSNLQELRKARHLTQQELAEQIGYSDKSISKWELGKAVPSVDILIDFASFFGVSVDYLISEREPGEVQKSMNTSLKKKRNQIIFIALAICFIYAVAGTIDLTNIINHKESLWMAFVWAIPVSFFAAAMLNLCFWRRTISFYIFLSLFAWTLIMAFQLHFLFYSNENIWYIYLLIIPVQIGIILMANLR